MRDDLLSNYANDEVIVGGVLFGDEDNSAVLVKIFWNIHEIIKNENGFTMMLQHFLMKKESIEIKVREINFIKVINFLTNVSGDVHILYIFCHYFYYTFII